MEGGVFKERLGRLLMLRGMSQRELALKTNLTDSAISRYLTGEREPRGAILLNVANALSTTPEYLRGQTDIVELAGKSDDIDKAFRLIARHADNLSEEDKMRFANIIFGGKSSI